MDNEDFFKFVGEGHNFSGRDTYKFKSHMTNDRWLGSYEEMQPALEDAFWFREGKGLEVYNFCDEETCPIRNSLRRLDCSSNTRSKGNKLHNELSKAWQNYLDYNNYAPWYERVHDWVMTKPQELE